MKLFFFQEFLYLVLLVTSVGFYWFLFGRFAPFLLRLKFILVIVWFWKSICYSFEGLKRMNTSLWEIDHRKYKYQGCYCGVRSSQNLCKIRFETTTCFFMKWREHFFVFCWGILESIVSLIEWNQILQLQGWWFFKWVSWRTRKFEQDGWE